MILKSLSAAIIMLIMVAPLYAEDSVPVDQAKADAQPETPASPIEARVRAWRESFERQRKNSPTVDESTSRRQQEIEAQMEARRQAWLKEREERRELAAKWREAKRKFREARMETWLKQAEDRQLRDISRHEAMRNQAEEQYNYLVENKDKLMEERLQQKIDAANRHEELRKQAEERRKELAILRENMKNMTPEERRAEIRKHYNELFGETETAQRMVPASRTPWRVPPPGPQYARPPAAE